VKWFGEYPDEDLPRRMAEADFLVLPSVTVEERFGIVLLEAMAAGRPIITTAVPTGVREVNVPGETGLEVPLQDVAALAEALETSRTIRSSGNRWATRDDGGSRSISPAH
jgi:rhamnosyl/mannosyltransferase